MTAIHGKRCTDGTNSAEPLRSTSVRCHRLPRRPPQSPATRSRRPPRPDRRSVRAGRRRRPRPLLARVQALQAFLATPDGANLLAGAKRAANILRIEEAKDGAKTGDVDAALLVEPAESALAAALSTTLPVVEKSLAEEDFSKAMQSLSALRAPVDDLLGGKGANLAEMSSLGLPVPPGFTITTEACALLRQRRKATRPSWRPGRRGSGQDRGLTGKASATRPTRCWCRCARARAPRCRA
jgi:hypothetical protein